MGRIRESELYAPVRNWLVARGYEIHVELFDADIIAVKDGKLLAVELKACLTDALLMQLIDRASWADEVMGAIGSTPRSTDALKKMGYGLLLVSGHNVRQRLTPKPQPWHWHKKRAYRIKQLTGRTPAMEHEVAGLPANNALWLQRRLRGE